MGSGIPTKGGLQGRAKFAPLAGWKQIGNGEHQFEHPPALIYKVARPLQFRAISMGLVAQQGFDPRAVNIGGPFAPEDIHRGKLEEQIADRHRVKHICVEEGRVLRHGR